MLMAHKQYWEDSGTPSGSDDYGVEGLRNVLLTRLQKASDIRYSMRYVAVHQQCKTLQPGCRAAVDVLIDASFTIANPLGRPSGLAIVKLASMRTSTAARQPGCSVLHCWCTAT